MICTLVGISRLKVQEISSLSWNECSAGPAVRACLGGPRHLLNLGPDSPVLFHNLRQKDVRAERADRGRLGRSAGLHLGQHTQVVGFVPLMPRWAGALEKTAANTPGPVVWQTSRLQRSAHGGLRAQGSCRQTRRSCLCVGRCPGKVVSVRTKSVQTLGTS